MAPRALLDALAAFGFAAAVWLSFFRFALAYFTKISLSRFLEDWEKAGRQRILDGLDETRAAVAVLRDAALLLFAVALFADFPRGRAWFAGYAIAVAGSYYLLFDLLPRAVAAWSGGKLLRPFLPAMGAVRALAAPLLWPSRGFRRREEREEGEEEREATEEEIETFIDSAQEEGIIERGEHDLLRSVVEFGGTVVREIMTPRLRMVCLRKDATIDNLKDLIIREKYSRIPIYKDRLDNIEGIALAKDLLEYSDEKHKDQPIEALIRPVGFVPESMEIADLLREFRRMRQNMAIVVDEHGGVSGLVTMEDVLEELVGEIRDEYDTEESQIHENGPRDYTVSGETEIEELEELFDVELAEDDFLSVGGLLIHHLARLPRKGETVEAKGLTWEVLDVDEKRVKKVRVRGTAAAPGGPARE